jgi:hypothetical protein
VEHPPAEGDEAGKLFSFGRGCMHRLGASSLWRLATPSLPR